MRRDTRRFARRQRTWCRGVPEAVWVRPDDGAEIAKRVEEFLAG
jgi:tRNA A37 N6-isopentenylltransferase MiaA